VGKAPGLVQAKGMVWASRLKAMLTFNPKKSNHAKNHWRTIIPPNRFRQESLHKGKHSGDTQSLKGSRSEQIRKARSFFADR
jgi:hypothetical protein